MKFKAKEPELAPRQIEVDIDQKAEGGRKISSHESEELSKLDDAHGLQVASAALEIVGSALGLIPQFHVAGKPIGIGGEVGFGGIQLSRLLSGIASSLRIGADQLSYEATRTSKIGGYDRRQQEWAFQSNSAAGEITQLFKQLRAAQIREAIAEREWKNHQQQIKHSEEIEHFLNAEGTEKNGKKSNKTLYTWMKREVRGLYSQCFQFAFDVAKKAERALQHELGNTDLTYLQFGYMGGKEGLLAGEKLYLDLKRMEMAYHDLNQREYELTKHISLLQINPLALLQLRATGRCTVSLPEELFDLDCPGHYFRRIKNVALTIPCVAGPYTSVNCTLTLLKSSIRKSPLVGDDGYARTDADDARFSDHFGSMEGVVTSTAQNDSGLHETNLRDERYLPFELSGAVGEWQLQLPADPSKSEPQQFNYDTIADVILHLRYTSREGGGLLRNGAVANLNDRINEAQAAGSVRLFSVRHEFPTEWARFKSTKGPGNTTVPAELAIALREEHYPLWSRGRLEAVKRFDILAKTTAGNIELSDGAGHKDSLIKDKSFGNLRRGKLTNIPLPAPIGAVTLNFNDNSIDDLWYLVTWGQSD